MTKQTVGHTPGPWKFEEYHGGEKQAARVREVLGREPTRALTNDGFAFVSTDGGLIAQVAPQRTDVKKRDLTTMADPERTANARLIASATDLLEVCEAVAALADGQGQRNLMEVAGQARAALAKATV